MNTAMKRHPVMAIMAVLLVVAMYSKLAAAECTQPYEVGTWVPEALHDSKISRLEISYGRDCEDSGADWSPAQGPLWHIAAIGKCGTGLCSWGRTGAMRSDDKRWQYSLEGEAVRPLFVAFDRGTIQEYLFIQAPFKGDGSLIVRLFSDHAGQGIQPSKSKYMIFVKQDGAATGTPE